MNENEKVTMPSVSEMVKAYRENKRKELLHAVPALTKLANMIGAKTEEWKESMFDDMAPEKTMTEQGARVKEALEQVDFGCHHEKVVKILEAVIGDELPQSDDAVIDSWIPGACVVPVIQQDYRHNYDLDRGCLIVPGDWAYNRQRCLKADGTLGTVMTYHRRFLRPANGLECLDFIVDLAANSPKALEAVEQLLTDQKDDFTDWA